MVHILQQNIIIHKGEDLERILIFSDRSMNQADFRIALKNQAVASIVMIVMPGMDLSAKFSVDIEEPYADCRLSGIYLCNNDNKVDINVEMRHLVGQCTSCQTFKGIVSGTARVKFHGGITVYPHAQRTEAYQGCHSLSLSDTAKVSTEPHLEIYADDVKCSHGATVGKLNEDEQFYMRSRGISAMDAKILQMISFISPIIDSVTDETRRSQLRKDIENAIRSGFLQ